ncbi:unnamed protein product [Pseudo-nitzschia multistriata]|uniref:Uncharacterized protein n=1 Tax=Pseudo-nitzschia multistriata TaxID=183589 RepID=A0A448ZHE8_9STRA|nr:unnamed protein product [Pseudo-nitzschia multistriata]
MGGCYSCSCIGHRYGIITKESDYVEEAQERAGIMSPPVKATIVKGYKDESLYKTMQECKDVRKSLRKVKDPDVARREKKMLLKKKALRYKIKGKDTSDGYLGMTPGSLQHVRRSLRHVDQDRTKPNLASE